MIRSVIPSESRGIPLRKLKGNLNEIPRLGSGGKVEAARFVNPLTFNVCLRWPQ